MWFSNFNGTLMMSFTKSAKKNTKGTIGYRAQQEN
jgi:hypothetical protein